MGAHPNLPSSKVCLQILRSWVRASAYGFEGHNSVQDKKDLLPLFLVLPPGVGPEMRAPGQVAYVETLERGSETGRRVVPWGMHLGRSVLASRFLLWGLALGPAGNRALRGCPPSCGPGSWVVCLLWPVVRDGVLTLITLAIPVWEAFAPGAGKKAPDQEGRV